MSGRKAAVIVASTRAASGVRPDRTGPLVAGWIADRGWDARVVVVSDGPPVGAALRAALRDGCRLILTTGGTGLTPTDRTPEETRGVIDREIPGIAEELRRRGAAHTPYALLSRGLAGIAGDALVVNLPGSPGGVNDGLAVIAEFVEHALEQIVGGDHGGSA